MIDVQEMPEVSLRSRIMSALPLIMIFVMGMLNMLFCGSSILPGWMAHESLNSEVAENRAAAEAQLAQQTDSTDVLQAQIEQAEEELTDKTSLFLTPIQVDGVLNRLYQYATESGVEITNLQSQQAAQTVSFVREDADAAASDFYSIRMFRLQLAGETRNLVNFIIRLREALVPSVIITNLNLVQGETQATLVMDLTMYVSPYSSGEALLTALSSEPSTLIELVEGGWGDTSDEEAAQFITPTATHTPTLTPTSESAQVASGSSQSRSASSAEVVVPTSTPQPTSTTEPTDEPEPTEAAKSTEAPAATAARVTVVVTAQRTVIVPIVVTATPSSTPTPSTTALVSPTASHTPLATATLPPDVTATFTLTPTVTNTPDPLQPPTETPTLTPTFTETPTETPTLTATFTETPTETPTLTPTFTETPTETPTDPPVDPPADPPLEPPTEP